MIIRILFISIFVLTSISSEAQVLLGSDSIEVNYAMPKEYEIAGVSVVGTEFTDKNIVKLISGLSEGDKVQVPGDKFSDAIENIWKQGLFDDVQIRATRIIAGKIYLEISVVERPRLARFGFKGVKKGEQDDLREKIKLIKGKVLTDYLVASTLDKVKSHYVNKGFYNCSVTSEVKKDSTLTNSVIFLIVVNKGKKVKIKDVIINGNTQMKDLKLRMAMKDTKRKRWYNMFNSSKYLVDNYEKDKLKLIEKYNDKGFRDARLIKDTVFYVSPDRVRIEITIDEGRKYYFRNITWVGNTKYTSRELSNILGIEKGEVFNQAELDKKLNMNPNGTDISSLYMDDGYLFFQVQPVEVLVENDSIDMEMRIYEGKQATINRVTVIGNTKTNDRVIMREMYTRPGELFKRSNIIRTQRQLSQLGYFNAEKMDVRPIPNPQNGTVDIEYVVEEKPSDQVELSGGWGAGRIVGTLGVTFNNFSARNFNKKDAWRPLPSGDGQRLSIRAQSTGVWYQSYNFSFTEPWLGGKKPNSLSLNVYHSVQTNGQNKYLNKYNVVKDVFQDIEKVENPFRQELTITGVGVGFGKRLKKPDDYFQLYQELNYQHYNLKNFQRFFSFSNGVSNIVSYKFNLSRNSIDKPIFETRGSNISFTAQLTPPYSLMNGKDYSKLSDQERYKWVEYQKYKFTAQWFMPLTNKRSTEGKEVRNLVLMAKAGYGFLGTYNTKVGTSPFERFYLGGSGLTGFALDGREIIALRGYNDQTLSPSSGAAFITKYTTELRFPITLNPSATIYILGFAEAGNSWVKSKDFSPFNLKRSAGAGVRIFLPMFGLLGFDYGWGFDTVDGNPGTGRNPFTGKAQGQFHFTIGAYLGEL